MSDKRLRNLLRRSAALLCALALPATGLAEMAVAVDEAEAQAVAEQIARETEGITYDEAYFLEHFTFFATGYDLTFAMDEHTEDPALLGIAQLLNTLRLQGKFEQMNSVFDTEGVLTMDGARSTETSYHLYGFPSHIAVESSLLGESRVLLNMQGFLEFAMKLFNHMEIPAQRLAILYPYATEDAMVTVRGVVEPVLFAEQGDREIPVSDLVTLCETLTDQAYGDRALSTWISALSSETGLGDVLVDALYGVSDWLTGEVGEDESLHIATSEGSETWTLGETQVFIRTVDAEAGSDVWSLELPGACYGEAVRASMNRHGGDLELQLQLGEEESYLAAEIVGTNLPEHLNAAGDFTLDISLTGSCAGALPMLRYQERNGESWLVCATDEEGIHVRVEGSSDEVRLVDAATGKAMLTLRAAWPFHWPLDHWPLYSYEDIQGINVFSINDETIRTLISAVLKPAVLGGIPLVAHAPVSTVSLLMDTLENAGMFSAEGGMDWGE